MKWSVTGRIFTEFFFYDHEKNSHQMLSLTNIFYKCEKHNIICKPPIFMMGQGCCNTSPP